MAKNIVGQGSAIRTIRPVAVDATLVGKSVTINASGEWAMAAADAADPLTVIEPDITLGAGNDGSYDDGDSACGATLAVGQEALALVHDASNIAAGTALQNAGSGNLTDAASGKPIVAILVEAHTGGSAAVLRRVRATRGAQAAA